LKSKPGGKKRLADSWPPWRVDVTSGQLAEQAQRKKGVGGPGEFLEEKKGQVRGERHRKKDAEWGHAIWGRSAGAIKKTKLKRRLNESKHTTGIFFRG